MVSCAARINVTATQIYGSLTIGSVFMHRPAFAVTDCSDLWLGPNQRGDDLMIPLPGPDPVPAPSGRPNDSFRWSSTAGSPRQERRTQATSSRGSGRCCCTCERMSRTRTGSGDGTRTISLVTPGGGSPMTGRAYVLGIEPERRKVRCGQGC